MNWTHTCIKSASLIYGFCFRYVVLFIYLFFKNVDEPPLDKAGHVKDASLEDGVIISEHGEDEMDMESEKEEEKPKAGGAFSNALSSLNVLRPGTYLQMFLRTEVIPQEWALCNDGR